MYSDSSESDEDLGLLRKALDVKLPEDFDPNKIPQNGEEYIQHVMYETRMCKPLVSVPIESIKVKKQTYILNVREECEKAPNSMRPSLKWQEEKVADFSKLCKFVETKIVHEPGWKEIQQGHWKKLKLTTPKFSILGEFSQNAKITILNFILNELETVKSGESFNYETGAWIYSILATLDVPLCADSCHFLRELARKCSVIRSKLPEDAPEDIYGPLNLYICLVARYFKQFDLADNED